MNTREQLAEIERQKSDLAASIIAKTEALESQAEELRDKIAEEEAVYRTAVARAALNHAMEYLARDPGVVKPEDFHDADKLIPEWDSEPRIHVAAFASRKSSYTEVDLFNEDDRAKWSEDETIQVLVAVSRSCVDKLLG